MVSIKKITSMLVLLGLVQFGPAYAAEPTQKAELKIDVPVQLKASKVVFNMDHLAFAGDQSIGLTYMKLMLQNYKASQTPIHIVAVFHGPAGYMLLNDQTYNKVRRSEKGNPFKDQILALQQNGVEIEECGQTARSNNWVNSDLLPGIKVNTGANLRLVQLVQDGYVQLQP